MNVYIDIDHLRSLAKSASHPQFASCIEAIRVHCDLFFTFDKSVILKEKKQSRTAIETLLKGLTRGRGIHRTEWDHPSPFSLQSTDSEGTSRLTPEQLMSVYLLADERLQSLSEQGLLLVSSLGDELKTLTRLFLGETFIPSRKYPTREMTDWSILRQNALPCTDIVIIDPYLFAQPDWLYDYNAFAAIGELASHVCGAALNIVIFTKSDYLYDGKQQEVDFICITRRLKEILRERTGCAPHLTFVCLPLRTEHDRSILTNYSSFDSGDSFKYFDSEGRYVSHGSWLFANTHLDSDNQRQALTKLSELQQLLDGIKDGVASITGDKRSGFLQF